MRYQFIEAHRQEFRVRIMCRVLAVSPSGYYAWRKRPTSAREMANQQLLAAIKTAHEDSNQTYGSPRIYHELKERVACSANRVARLMKKHGIHAKHKRRYKHTTQANAAHAVAPNLLAGDFSASAPNQKWTGDITYIPTQEGWLYLAVILDLFARRIVGWAMSARMTSQLVHEALHMAIDQRQPAAGLIHHSDRGSQYTSADYQHALNNQRFQVSMSGSGHCYDNAPTESFFGRLKIERVHLRSYATRAEAQTDLFRYIEVFYNRTRRHSSLGYLSPAVYEAAYHQRSALTVCP